MVKAVVLHRAYYYAIMRLVAHTFEVRVFYRSGLMNIIMLLPQAPFVDIWNIPSPRTRTRDLRGDTRCLG
jgi:hypothetical protein